MKRKVKVEIIAGDTLLCNMRDNKTGELIRWEELTQTEQSQVVVGLQHLVKIYSRIIKKEEQ